MIKRIQKTISSFLLPALLAGVIIWVLGYDPIEAYTELFKGAFVGKFSLGTTLERFGPIFLTALAFAVSIKVKFFNLGAEGAFYWGALAAAGLGQIQGLPMYVHIPLTLLGGILLGALWQAIPGFLRAFYNVNEACTTIMFNYIAVMFSSYMVLNPSDSLNPKMSEAIIAPIGFPPPKFIAAIAINPRPPDIPSTNIFV